MSDLVELFESPIADETYMIAGWYQWADAGATSSGLPRYLIEQLNSRLIGRMHSDTFYMFQIPGTHDLLRPLSKFVDGYPQNPQPRDNQFFYAEQGQKGLVIFLGEEPHLNIDLYADALFYVAQELNIKRIVALGGVYGSMPYDKDRQISSAYSMPYMKDELSPYILRFSNYEGGASIGSYFVERASQKGIELFTLYAFVPAYDFSQLAMTNQGVRVESDFKAWYDIMHRLNHMFNMDIDLDDLARQGDTLLESMDEKIDELEKELPQVNIREHIANITQDFEEATFMPLGDVWEEGLGDLLEGLDEED